MRKSTKKGHLAWQRPEDSLNVGENGQESLREPSMSGTLEGALRCGCHHSEQREDTETRCNGHFPGTAGAWE